MKPLVHIIHKWDHHIFHRIFALNGKRIFDGLFKLLSKSGDGPLYGFIGIVLFMVDSEHEKNLLLTGFVAFSIKVPLFLLLKRSIQRIRPYERNNICFLIPPPDRYSFPSGHTASAFIVALIFGFYYPLMIVPLLVWASLIGFSRIYLGLHYPSDVVAGVLLGLMCVKIALSVIG